MVDFNVGYPVQADDIALISSNVPFMQSLIDMCSIQQKMEIQVFSSKKSSNEIHETYNAY